VKQHTDYLLAQLRSIVPLAEKTFVAPGQRDAAGKLPSTPYVVVYPSEGTDSADRFTGPKLTQHPDFTLHIVGADYDNTVKVAALIKGKFVVNGVGVQPLVTNERSRNLRYSSPQPIQVDYDSHPALVFAVAEISWDAEPV